MRQAEISAGFTSRFAITRTTILSGVATGDLIGFVIACLEILLQGPAALTLRRLPMPVVFLLRTAIYGGIFVGANTLAALLLRLSMPETPLPGPATLDPGNLLFFVAAALVFNFIFLLRSLLGGRTLIALLTGRYHRPKSEERIILFLDLCGSTELAEKLGDEAFHRFLNRVFFDVTEPVLEAGGEICRRRDHHHLAARERRPRRGRDRLPVRDRGRACAWARRISPPLRFRASAALRAACHAVIAARSARRAARRDAFARQAGGGSICSRWPGPQATVGNSSNPRLKLYRHFARNLCIGKTQSDQRPCFVA
jgi:hypothetical protein